MAYPSATLTSGNYTSLRGATGAVPTYQAQWFTCLCPNTIIFKALVNGAASGASYAQINFDTVTTGAYTDIKVGQTVLIGTDSDIRKATFVGRIRKTPTSTIVYFNETSIPIADNANIWVIDDYRIWDKLARESAGVQYKDYDETFAQLKPIIYNLQSAYAGVVSGSPEGYIIAFSASVLAGTSGATISTYSWSIGDGTVTAGSTSSASVTVRFPAGFRWISLTVTDNGSRSSVRRIPIWAIPTDYSSVVTTGIDQIGIQGSLDQGWNGGLNAWTGVDTVLDNTLACIFRNETYNGTQGSLLNNVAYVGRLRTERSQNRDDNTAWRVQDTRLELEGAATQMSRIEHLPFALIHDTTPTVWDEINNLTIWRAIAHCLQRHSTVLELHSLSFSDTTNNFIADQLGVSGGNILGIVRDLAESINGSVEFAPTGEIRVVRDARYLSTSARSALLTYGNWTTQDLVSFELDVDHNDTVGLVQAAGGSYQSGSDTVLVVPSTAPGLAQNTPEGVSPLMKQILTAESDRPTAETELNERTGHHLAASNPTDKMSITHPSGYGSVLIPSRIVWYTFTIATTDNTRGRAYTTSNRWLLTEVSLDHDNATGVTQSTATYELETSGSPGQAIYPPAYAEENNDLPIMYGWTPYPTFIPELPTVYLPINPGGIPLPPLIGDPSSYPSISAIKADGNTVLFGTENRLYATRKFITSNTVGELDLTPSTIGASEVIQHAVWGAGYDAYLLTYDGTNSYVWYTDNVLSLGAGWTKGAALTGEWNFIRKTATQGTIYVVGRIPNTAANWNYEWDFTAGRQGWYLQAFNSVTGSYSAGNGWQAYGKSSDNTLQVSVVSPRWLYDVAFTKFDVEYSTTYNITGGIGDENDVRFNTYDDNSGGEVSPLSTGTNTGTILKSGLVPQPTTIRQMALTLFQRDFDGVPTAIPDGLVSAYIRKLKIYGTGTNPFDANIQTRYSTDYGATFATAVTVGAITDFAYGADTSKIGTQIIATYEGQPRKASAGGAYSNYGGAKETGAILLPRYQPDTDTTDNSGSSPEFVMFAGMEDSSHTMWYWDGSAYQAITPTQSSINGVSVSPHCLDGWWQNGKTLACIGSYDGTYRLKTSIDGGTTWTDRGTLSDDVAYVRFRRGDKTGKQLFISDGTPYYSSDRGATKQAKTYPESPSTAPVLFIEPYG